MNQPENEKTNKSQFLSLFFKKSLFWLENSPLSKVLRFLISLLLIIYLFISINWLNVSQTFRSINIQIIVLAFIISIFIEYFSIKRHQLILRQMGEKISWWQMTKLYFFGLFASIYLPAGADISKFLLLKTRNRVRLKTSAISLIYDRLIGLAGVATILAGSVIALSLLHLPLVRLWMVSLSVGYLLLLILVLVIAFVRNRQTTQAYFNCLLLSVTYVFFVVTVTLLIGLAIYPGVNVGWFFASVPIICFGSMLPISIGGLGVREWLFIFFASYLGLTREGALSVSLILWIFSLMEGLVGAAIYIFEQKEK